MRNVAVFFGGKSNEHEISVISGLFAVNLLRSAGYEVHPVFLRLDGEMRYKKDLRDASELQEERGWSSVCLEKGGLCSAGKRRKTIARLDCALNACHGGAGEDGTLSALLSWHEIPFASPPMPVSAIFMDKAYAHVVAKGLDIPTLPSRCVRESEWKRASRQVICEVEKLGYPVVVKPALLGSSIGISVAYQAEQLSEGLDLAFRFGDRAVVERYLEGKRDINCAAYVRKGETVTSQCEEVFSVSKILTFSEKYEANVSSRNAKKPADLPQEIAERITSYTVRMYEAFDCRGVVRVDYLYADGNVYFNELNAVPGSFAYYLFGETLTSARDLLKEMVEDCLAEKREEKQIVKTGILQRSAFGTKGKLRL